jgi:tetratricopeptide (TPR) repeat protein
VRQYLGRPGDALEAFERAVALDPAYDDAILALGTALFESGDLVRAREVLGGIVERNPEHAGALAELGRSHLGDDLDRALELYERAASHEAWNGSLFANQGMILAAMGRFDEALERTREALRRDPEDGAAWETYARILHQLGRADEAREAASVAARMAGVR